MIFLGTHQLRGGVYIFFYKVSFQKHPNIHISSKFIEKDLQNLLSEDLHIILNDPIHKTPFQKQERHLSDKQWMNELFTFNWPESTSTHLNISLRRRQKVEKQERCETHNLFSSCFLLQTSNTEYKVHGALVLDGY